MTWPLSNPKLAREASTLFAELELAAKVARGASRDIMVDFDRLARLLSMALSVVPDHIDRFVLDAKQFTEELPPESAARIVLEYIFRREGHPNEEAKRVFRLYWSTRWYSVGCPAVTIDRNLAASLMATEIAEEFIDAVRPPWECFIVRLPSDFMEKGDIPFTHLVVHRYVQTFETDSFDEAPESARSAVEKLKEHYRKMNGTVWALFGRSNNIVHLAEIQKLAVLLGKEEGEFLISGSLEIGVLPEDRLVRALARLVVGICHLAEKPNAMRRKSTKKKQHNRWRFSKLPLTTEYVLAPDIPVKFDCSEAIGAYLRGDRKALPRFQYLVRGHWRNQAHGTGRIDRKRIWIQPYWKGPEDMPRLFREHRFEAASEGSGRDA